MSVLKNSMNFKKIHGKNSTFYKRNWNKFVEYQILELKIKLNKMKNVLEIIKDTIDEAEERINKLKDKVVKNNRGQKG